MGQRPVFPATPAMYGAKFQNADGTALKDLFTSPDGGMMLGVLRAASDDTAGVVLQFAVQLSGTDYVLGEVQIPAGSGTNSTTGWVDLLDSLNLGEAMNLPAGAKLRAKAKTAVTAAKVIDIVAEGGQF